MADDQDQLISHFVAVTSSTVEQANAYLSENDWDINLAVTAYYRDSSSPGASSSAAAPAAAAPAAASAAAPAAGSSNPAGRSGMMAYGRPAASFSKPPPKKTGLATLSSLGGNDEEEDDDDDDDDDYDETRQPRDLFAGGEKSGLAVQDPAQGASSGNKKLIQDILSQARSNAARPGGPNPAAATPSSSRFHGSGQTLGGDGVESRVIPGADAAAAANRPVTRSQTQGETQERVLHLWNDGFSVDDGPLHRFDDPRNRTDLDMIRNGRAPLHLMNVRLDQPVDVKLQQHHEDWHQLPRVYRPFAGEGHRLGSPVPGDGSSGATASAPTGSAATTTTATSTSTSTPTTDLDESQPTLTIRIQLPDGTRLPARFNTTQTVDDVYQFVERASAATQARPWVLATTFPNKDHTDRGLVLGDMAEFKKGGTAVVKWA